MTGQRNVIVTGGSSGIGFAIAKRFICGGFRTIITGRNLERLNNAASELGENCVGEQFDMEWLDKMPDFVKNINRKYGGIDVLVNNAGINQKKPFTDVTDEDFKNIVMVNQTALFVLTREVIKSMLDNHRKGVIINISSMAAHFGIPKVVSYASSKSALEGMTRAMAVELSPLGIRVNCVAPGFIRTPMSSKAFENDVERKNKVLSRTPMGTLGEPDDVANAVFFLASDQAFFITGETLKVDGGNSIGF